MAKKEKQEGTQDVTEPTYTMADYQAFMKAKKSGAFVPSKVTTDPPVKGYHMNANKYAAEYGGVYANQGYTGIKSGDKSGKVTDATERERLLETLRVFPRSEEFMNVTRDKEGQVTEIGFKDRNSIIGFQKYVNKVYTNLETRAATLPEGQRDKYVEVLGSLKFKPGTVAKGFDGTYGDFTSSRGGIKFDVVSPDELKGLADRGITNYSQMFENGELKPDLGLSPESLGRLKTYAGDFKGSEIDFQLGELVPTAATPTPQTTVPETTGTPLEEVEEKDKEMQFGKSPIKAKRPGINPAWARVAAPDPLMTHQFLKANLQTIDPNHIDPAIAQNKIVNQGRAAQQGIDMRGDSAREALSAYKLATEMSAINQAEHQADTSNLGDLARVDQYNAQVYDKNTMEKMRALREHEKLNLTAVNTTRTDVRNYLDKVQNLGFERDTYQNQYSMLNNFYKNAFLDSNQGARTDGSIYFKDAASYSNYQKQQAAKKKNKKKTSK